MTSCLKEVLGVHFWVWPKDLKPAEFQVNLTKFWAQAYSFSRDTLQDMGRGQQTALNLW